MDEIVESLSVRARADSRGAAGTTEGAREVERLFHRCEARLGAFLAQMVANRALADDLLQDTFYEALRQEGRLPEIERPEAWLFGIARNRALVVLRRRRRFGRALERLRERPEPTQGDDLELVVVRDLLERSLEPEDRALVLLRYLHDFSAAELAAMTGRRPEVVRQRLSRARSRLIRESGITRPSTQGEETDES